MNTKIELLSPVGDFSCFTAAIKAKADSIYFGLEDLNMRSFSSSNFKIEDLEEISAICRKHGIKSYLTLNTIIYNKDIKRLKQICLAAKNAKIDAIITSDFSVIQEARLLNINVHISTQANVSNIEAVKFFSKYANVIVLARELKLDQITSICDSIKKEKICGPDGNLIKIEIFVHGALCIGISGRCYMSLAQYNMSANRGECLQACRRKYRVIEEETQKELLLDNKYIMSPRDLCTITVLDQILKSGVSILKIEGRARSAEYVDMVVKTYKNAVDAIYNRTYTKDKIDSWIKDLKTVFNRGFWYGGYYLGEDFEKWSASYGSKATKKKIYVGKATNYFSKIKVAEFILQAHDLKIGDEILIVGSKTGVVKSNIEDLRKYQTSILKNEKKIVSFPIKEKIRKNDKLYILKENSEI
jgi:putative protease